MERQYNTIQYNICVNLYPKLIHKYQHAIYKNPDV